jgi:hypothetical protein
MFNTLREKKIPFHYHSLFPKFSFRHFDLKSIVKILRYWQTGSDYTADLKITYMLQLIIIKLPLMKRAQHDCMGMPPIKAPINAHCAAKSLSKSNANCAAKWYWQTGSDYTADLKITYMLQLIIIKLQTKYKVIPIFTSQEILYKKINLLFKS